MDEKNTLASEVLEMLKGQLKFYKFFVVILVVLLAATNIYHIWQWSQFDTIAVESGDGYANYVAGENTGGIYNGADQSTSTQGRQSEGNQDSGNP
ncbi:MAG: hypothetical protein Q4A76_10100 [Porphyromonadaceae bacterium]|uniref:hypothetical protein n=1 Tax=Agathobaculum desmolans TaxID=39484 RepID=UPI0004E228CA|nr:hypothetical protein [Agathobaculum desmolans]MDO4673255.1 hypothetical protein [Porphyromonadaceae bacterium]